MPLETSDNNPFGMPDIYGTKRVGLPSQQISIEPKDPRLCRRYSSTEYLQQSWLS